MKLIELGKVRHVSRSGMIVVQLDPSNVPKIGDKVVTKKMEHVGFVQDIIGPVSSPCALVRSEKRGNYDVLYVVKEYGRTGKGEIGKGEGSREGSRKERDRKRRRH